MTRLKMRDRQNSEKETIINLYNGGMLHFKESFNNDNILPRWWAYHLDYDGQYDTYMLDIKNEYTGKTDEFLIGIWSEDVFIYNKKERFRMYHYDVPALYHLCHQIDQNLILYQFLRLPIDYRVVLDTIRSYEDDKLQRLNEVVSDVGLRDHNALLEFVKSPKFQIDTLDNFKYIEIPAEWNDIGPSKSSSDIPSKYEFFSVVRESSNFFAKSNNDNTTFMLMQTSSFDIIIDLDNKAYIYVDEIQVDGTTLWHPQEKRFAEICVDVGGIFKRLYKES